MRYIAVVLAMSLGALAFAQEGAAPPPPPPAETPPQAEPEPAMPETPELAQRLLNALNLTPDQSAQLLELLDQLVASRTAARLAQADVLEQLAAALRADADPAVFEQVQANALAGALTRRAEQAGLAIRIRALLTEDQLNLLRRVAAVERAMEPAPQGGRGREPRAFGRRDEGFGLRSREPRAFGFLERPDSFSGPRGREFRRSDEGFGPQSFGPELGRRGQEGQFEGGPAHVRRLARARHRGGADPIIQLLTRPAFLEALRGSQPQQ